MALGHQILLRIMPFAENANQYIYHFYCCFFALSSQEVALKSLKVYTLIMCFTDPTTCFFTPTLCIYRTSIRGFGFCEFRMLK